MPDSSGMLDYRESTQLAGLDPRYQEQRRAPEI